MELVLIPAGSFRMGTPPDEPARQADETLHEVVIGAPFYLGKYEVTQAEWMRVMHRNPSRFTACGPRCPVETVSYDDIQLFVRRLTEVAHGARFRLPTEAEWEYACRAGSRSAFATGSRLTARQANFDDRSIVRGQAPAPYLGRPVPVGGFPPNRWGLHDMHGNVWEWCEDWYGDYPAGPVRDPRGPARTAARRIWDARGGDWQLKRVIRGGSWYFGADSCRCGLRYTHSPADKGFSVGFRLLREADVAVAPATRHSAALLRR